MLEVWKAIERTGVQTAIELREALGKELTEAAILRALHDLWTSLRVILLPGSNGEPATWEALKTRFESAMTAGKATSQVTALSVLLARYLQTAVAATSEEAEVFLSPLASRTKVREVIRGLTATRQLSTYSLDAQPLLYVEGTLPEFGEPIDMADIEPIAAPAPPPPPLGTGVMAMDSPLSPSPPARPRSVSPPVQRSASTRRAQPQAPIRFAGNAIPACPCLPENAALLLSARTATNLASRVRRARNSPPAAVHRDPLQSRCHRLHPAAPPQQARKKALDPRSRFTLRPSPP